MFGTMAFFILLGTVLTFRLSILGEQARMVGHTNSVLHELDNIQKTLLEMETGYRGFFVTEDQSFLAPLAAGQDTLPRRLEVIRGLLADNNVQLANFNQLKDLTAEKIDEIKIVLRLWKEGHHDEAIDRIRDGNGKQIMSEIQTVTQTMQEVENSLLRKRALEFESSRSHTTILTYTAVSIIIIVSLLSLYVGRVFRKNEISLAKTSQSLKIANEAIKQSESEFRALANSVPQMVWVADSGGSYIYYNDRWFEYTGMSKNLEIASHWLHYLHPEDIEKNQLQWSLATEAGEPYEVEFRIQGIDGTYRWFIGRGIPVYDEKKSITQWFGTFTDIHAYRTLSEERELLLESERSARDESERAIKAKDDFVATLSHELRGPLNAILGWVQILHTKRNDHSLLDRGLEVIDRNTRLQSQLISDLFDFHRVQAGKVALNIESVYLSEVVTACADSISPACAEKEITLIRQITGDIPNIPGDGNRLTQVVMNLLSNCVKFTPTGGTITIRLEATHDIATIAVTDSGVGIDPEFLPNIFERYTQGADHPSKKTGGLGLGLSIAKSFVLLHRGTITASSKGVGAGSCFTVQLPCSNPEYTETRFLNSIDSKPDSLTLTLKNLAILLVEDQGDAREAVARMLAERGATVTTAVNGEQALQLLKEHQPDMIISDISMPGMDGYTFITQAKQLYPSIVAIALTAFSRKEDREKALAVGFSSHLTKPVDIAQLISEIIHLRAETVPEQGAQSLSV